MISQLAISFIGGLFTVLSPCVLPVLPFIFGATIDQSRSRAFSLIAGLILAFAAFTMFGGILLRSMGLSTSLLRNSSAVILSLFALMLIVPAFGHRVEAVIGKISVRGTAKSSGSGFVAGLALGLVWAPCAGPVLGAVSTLLAIQGTTLQALTLLSAFCAGVGVPLAAAAWMGGKVSAVKILRPAIPYLRKGFGVVCLTTAVLIATNRDAALAAQIADVLPVGISDSLHNIEDRLSQRSGISDLTESAADTSEAAARQNQSELPDMGVAPDFNGIEQWLNSAPLNIESLRGKVVLVDFWTYSCVNCVRTLPHLKEWYEKYHAAGLEIVGVHAPEFAFEHEIGNVRDAADRFGIKYPIAIDNQLQTWRAYQNHYWPAHYFIDIAGHIRFTHFGEGEYEQSESVIRALLKEKGSVLTATQSRVTDPESFGPQTPETYLGALRTERTKSELPQTGTCREIASSESLDLNSYALIGKWCLEREYNAAGGSDSALSFRVFAQNVYLVAQSDSPSTITVTETENGLTKHWEVGVEKPILYTIAKWADRGEHLLKLEVPEGTKLYAFTFG